MSIPLTYLRNRSVLRLSGEDTYDFLQGLITQDIHLLKTQDALYTWMLTSKGRYLFDFFIVKDGDDLLIDVGDREILKHFKLYKLRRKVDILETEMKVYTASTYNGEALSFDDPRKSSFTRRILTPHLLYDATDDISAYTYARIARGIPEFPHDLDREKSFPLESQLKEMNGVSFKKGCYIGQELVSRTHYTGVIRKSLLPFQFEDRIETGSVLTQNDHSVGEVRSSISHHGKHVAIAMIRTEECDLSQNIMCSNNVGKTLS